MFVTPAQAERLAAWSEALPAVVIATRPAPWPERVLCAYAEREPVTRAVMRARVGAFDRTPLPLP